MATKKEQPKYDQLDNTPMNIQVSYNTTNGLILMATMNTEADARVFASVTNFLRSTLNLKEVKTITQPQKTQQPETNPEPLASEKQLAYLKRLGIQVPENCTVAWADMMIKDYYRNN